MSAARLTSVLIVAAAACSTDLEKRLPASVASTVSMQSPAASVERVGDVAEPLEAFNRFLGALIEGTFDSAEGRALVAGEAAKEGYWHTIEPSAACDAIVRVDELHAVARVTIHDPGGPIPVGSDKLEVDSPARDINLYFYLEDTDAWRVTHSRTLAQMGLLAMMAALDEFAPQLDPELGWNAANARLTLSSDQQLVQWFAEHRAELESIATRSLELAGGQPASFSKDSDIGTGLSRLLVLGSSVDSDGAVEITIGGITDNVVALLRLPESAALPHISPDERIWAQSLGNGWFLFRTT